MRLACMYYFGKPLHFSALRNGHVLDRLLPLRARVLNLAHHIHAVDDLAKHDVLVVQEGRGHGSDEELGAVCVGTRILVMVSPDGWYMCGQNRGLTAMLSRPDESCLSSKFSSAKEREP